MTVNSGKMTLSGNGALPNIAAANAVQTISLTKVVGGTFQLSFNGQTTAPIPIGGGIIAVGAATEATNTVTITTSANHNLVVGEQVVISGVTNAAYNGTYTILTVPSATTFTYTDPTSGLAASTVAGTATLPPATNAAAIQAALQALPGIGANNVTVTPLATSGTVNQYFTVTFTGALAGLPEPTMTIINSGPLNASVNVVRVSDSTTVAGMPL